MVELLPVELFFAFQIQIPGKDMLTSLKAQPREISRHRSYLVKSTANELLIIQKSNPDKKGDGKNKSVTMRTNSLRFISR